MGYAKVFWIQEEPIREYISVNGRNDTIIEEVGRRILSFSAKDTGGFVDPDAPTSLPFFNTPSVFFPFNPSFHSTDFCLLIWTGNRLCSLKTPSVLMFDALCQLTGTVGTSHIIAKRKLDSIVAGEGWQNQLKQDVWASLYWIYEDFSRYFERVPETDWPCKVVGDAALDLMLSDWNRSANILNHGNALNRCCSFLQPEFTILVWRRNSLQLLSNFEDDKIQQMRNYIED